MGNCPPQQQQNTMGEMNLEELEALQHEASLRIAGSTCKAVNTDVLLNNKLDPKDADTLVEMYNLALVCRGDFSQLEDSNGARQNENHECHNLCKAIDDHYLKTNTDIDGTWQLHGINASEKCGHPDGKFDPSQGMDPSEEFTNTWLEYCDNSTDKDCNAFCTILKSQLAMKP